MLKSLIELLIEVSTKINFTAIVDFESQSVKIVDVNDYDIELFTIKIIHNSFYFYDENYIFISEYKNFSQIENMIYKTLLRLEFNIMLDNEIVDMDKFKKLMDCITVFEE